MNSLTEKTDLSKIDVIGGITASSVLVHLNISMWVGRKTDKKNANKIVVDNNAQSGDAAHVTKKLFVGNPKLEAITRKAAAARSYVEDKTLPWTGSLKLLPMSAFIQFNQDLEYLKDDFYAAVDAFLNDYDIQVSAMAFRLGGLFNKSEYPVAQELRHKFSLSWEILPVPAAGDFRVDAEASLRRSMQEAYSKAMEQKVEASMAVMWGRLKECLEHMVDRLGETDGKKNIFKNTLLSNAKELVNLLADFNLAQDPKMEQARQRLLNIIDHVEPDELRSNDAVRDDVKKSVSEILAKFSF